ncbi:hypothetical protein C8J56DRAFT_920396 [Mycena floridula]|nr:hypothetical protein C8J56DRAFT_920396 [Mycena floridula]
MPYAYPSMGYLDSASKNPIDSAQVFLAPQLYSSPGKEVSSEEIAETKKQLAKLEALVREARERHEGYLNLQREDPEAAAANNSFFSTQLAKLEKKVALLEITRDVTRDQYSEYTRMPHLLGRLAAGALGLMRPIPPLQPPFISPSRSSTLSSNCIAPIISASPSAPDRLESDPSPEIYYDIGLVEVENTWARKDALMLPSPWVNQAADMSPGEVSLLSWAVPLSQGVASGTLIPETALFLLRNPVSILDPKLPPDPSRGRIISFRAGIVQGEGNMQKGITPSWDDFSPPGASGSVVWTGTVSERTPVGLAVGSCRSKTALFISLVLPLKVMLKRMEDELGMDLEFRVKKAVV